MASDNGSISQTHQSHTWNLLRKLTGRAEPESQLQGYSLQLGDGSRWWVAGFPQADSWVEQMAAIMQMRQEKADGANMLVLLEGQTPPEKIKELATPDSGWLVPTIEYLHLNLWYRLDCPDLLAELNPETVLQEYTSLKFALHFIHRQSIQRGGLPFHAALVEHQGRGVLLAAASETGKSTCCRRIPPPWQVRCDDEVLVALAPDGRYLAHPFPTWSEWMSPEGGSTYNTQLPSDLAGVFFFEQAATDECLPLSPLQAAVETVISTQVVLARFFWYCTPEEGRRLRSTIFNNATALFKKVPAFRLKVSLTGRFWDHLEVALAKSQPAGSQKFFYRGVSMNPLLRGGDTMLLTPYGSQEIHSGDVVVFPHPVKGHVVHRVVAVSAEGVLTKGDSNPNVDDRLLAPDEIVGRVTAIQRQGHILPVSRDVPASLYILKARQWFDRVIFPLLQPVYQRLARSGLFQGRLAAWLKPQLFYFSHAGGPEWQLWLGNLLIGRKKPHQANWTIRRPFGLFIDETTLPH
jgi:signal peptidase I